MSSVELILGDNRELLPTLADSSVDAVVTDPPYGLRFMGKRWDYDVPSIEQWAECLRVLKPGGHLLAFAGTRTQHRMCCAIEDAGFEIRDMIAWVYGSGFPKTLNVGKAIDKAAGAEREVVGANSNAKYRTGRNNWQVAHDPTKDIITAPATEAAQQWDGWGTALKPALEPITLARKPFGGSVAANALEHGTGALNVGACRVDVTAQDMDAMAGRSGTGRGRLFPRMGRDDGIFVPNSAGRFPANLIHDGSPEVVGCMPECKPCGGPKNTTHNTGMFGIGQPGQVYADSGSAARFFYCSKASRADRGEGNDHPTVKPTDLMRYLCRLITPPGGVVLDPWMGSGSTGKAAVLEGFGFIGIELNPEYLEMSRKRIENPEPEPVAPDVPGQLELFGGD